MELQNDTTLQSKGLLSAPVPQISHQFPRQKCIKPIAVMKILSPQVFQSRSLFQLFSIINDSVVPCDTALIALNYYICEVNALPFDKTAKKYFLLNIGPTESSRRISLAVITCQSKIACTAPDNFFSSFTGAIRVPTPQDLVQKRALCIILFNQRSARYGRQTTSKNIVLKKFEKGLNTFGTFFLQSVL